MFKHSSMFTLVTDRSKYFRVKRGQCAKEIENVFDFPVNGRAFSGAIVVIGEKSLVRYTQRSPILTIPSLLTSERTKTGLKA